MGDYDSFVIKIELTSDRFVLHNKNRKKCSNNLDRLDSDYTIQYKYL